MSCLTSFHYSRYFELFHVLVFFTSYMMSYHTGCYEPMVRYFKLNGETAQRSRRSSSVPIVKFYVSLLVRYTLIYRINEWNKRARWTSYCTKIKFGIYTMKWRSRERNMTSTILLIFWLLMLLWSNRKILIWHDWKWKEPVSVKRMPSKNSR